MKKISEFNKLFEMAEKYYSLKAYSIALDIIENTLGLDLFVSNQSLISAHFLKSEINQALGKYKESISDLDKIIELGYEDLNIYNNRGLCKLELKLFSEAKYDFNKAIELNPKDSLSFYHRALAYHYLNKLKESHRDFKSAIYFLPNEEKKLHKEIFDNYQINLSKKNPKKRYFLAFLNFFIVGFILGWVTEINSVFIIIYGFLIIYALEIS